MECEDQKYLHRHSVNPELLFAWLPPSEKQQEDPTSALLVPAQAAVQPPHSPFLRAKSAIRKTLRSTVVSSGATLGLRLKRHAHKLRVREANDACLWLRAAGFPQYVQMFEDGQFPINLSKIQVERDHEFLEQADIESLVRRLNTLNRCADIMDDIKSKKDDDSEDERALSQHWTFRRRKKKWSRRPYSRQREASFSSSVEDILAEEEDTPTDPSPLLLVTELRKSLTGLDRAVKTYSFMPSDEQVPQILVDSSSPPLVTFNEETLSNGVCDKKLSIGQLAASNTSVDEGLATGGEDKDMFEYEMQTFPRGGLDTFATDMFSTFESNLVKLRSQSLPDIYHTLSPELYHGSDEEDELEHSPDSSASSTSMLHTSKDSILDDNSLGHSSPSTPILIKLNGDTEFKVIHRPANSLSSEAYESSESRPTTPVSPHKRNTVLLRERRQEQWSVSSNKRSSGGSSISQSRNEAPKWHSFQRVHSFRQAFKPVRTLIPIEELSVGQISVLRKLSLIKLTALIELYKAKSNIARILKGRKHKFPDFRHKTVFGVPLITNVRQSGRALPTAILAAIEHLSHSGLDTSGLFRKGASKAKLDGLKLVLEANPELRDFTDFTHYEMADLVKLYFRELPEPLFSSKFTETLIMIQENVPGQLRLQALQSVMLLMADENREALQTLLLFLKQVAENSTVNQMDASNLAVCLAPSLFTMSSPLPKPASGLGRVGSFRRTAINGPHTSKHSSPTTLATNKIVNESMACSKCLSEMISQAHKLFSVQADMLQVCKFTYLESGDPVPYHELGMDQSGQGSHAHYIETSIQTVHKELKKRFKGWVHHSTTNTGVDISYIKPADGIPLRVWRGVVDVEVSTDTVLKKIWNEKFLRDGCHTRVHQVAKVDERTEILQYVTPALPGFTDRDHCVLRAWDYDRLSESYVVTGTSVSHPSASLLAGIRATELVTRYLIERLDRERTRVTLITRVDMRGRSGEYYNSGYGPFLASTVAALKDSIETPHFLETRV